MFDLLARLIDDFHERPLPVPFLRDATMKRLPRRASAVVGMRRAGKTWFCFQEMSALIQGGVARERLLYLNFEDERLLPFVAADFQHILDAYYRKLPALQDQLCYLYLDEVHRIDGWELFVRRILDSERLVVCVTGSSSRLLSREIATSLRGRALTTEIFPFSFREFVRFRNPDLRLDGRFGARSRARIQNALEEYRRSGGFPEVLLLDDPVRREVLRGYVDVVILRDVIERHGVSNTVALRALLRAILSAPGTRFSVNRFYNTLRSRQVACTKNDLYAFLEHLEDAFLLQIVPLCTRSEKARQVNPKKIYAIDSGLLNLSALALTEDRGAALENLVFLHLRRHGYAPEYYLTEAGQEVDFVVATPDGGRALFQACWTLSEPATRTRELAALRAAMAELGVQRGTIVTWLEEFDAGSDVAIIPAWKWLLSAP